jgi:hypothetical protein
MSDETGFVRRDLSKKQKTPEERTAWLLERFEKLEKAFPPEPELTVTFYDDEPEQELLRNQFYCIHGNSGYVWMRCYMPTYDDLPRIVRQRLQQSPFNICTACLSSCLPRKSAGARPWREMLLMAVEIREHQIRSGRP